MKLAIMQPYFLPYPGYFQLIAAVDVFVVYDNIKYVKSGWINRNRLCRNGEAATFSLPLKHASDSLDVRERELAAAFDPDKLLNQFRGAYGRGAAIRPGVRVAGAGRSPRGTQSVSLSRALDPGGMRICSPSARRSALPRTSPSTTP